MLYLSVSILTNVSEQSIRDAVLRALGDELTFVVHVVAIHVAVHSFWFEVFLTFPI